MTSQDASFLALDAVPEGNSVIGVADCQELAVGAESNRINAQLRSLNSLQLLSGRDIPQLDFSPIRARECLLIRAEAQSSGISRERSQSVARCHVPKLDASTASSQHATVVVESDRPLHGRIRFSYPDRSDFIS